ncbi:Aa-trans domain-containing protein [Aphelenchoides fujianensis]|nr:Aa-trans domain-containing protein [Aphelenchoides fujianensis]
MDGHSDLSTKGEPMDEPPAVAHCAEGEAYVRFDLRPGYNTAESRVLDPAASPNASLLSTGQATMHLIKAMLGTGVLTLPLAFKHAGLYVGLLLLVVIAAVNLYCMRMVVAAADFVRAKTGQRTIDYANIMRGAVESGPPWIRRHGYFFKQLVNVNIFLGQLGCCSIYFVFMADNLQDFFFKNLDWEMQKGLWMLLIALPVLAICSIRRLSQLAPFAMAANFVYFCAIGIVVYFFFTNLQSPSSLVKVGKLGDLPLFFCTVMFAFEGVPVIMPIENKMLNPKDFVAWNGVLHRACLVVLTVFTIVGFFGYLAVGDEVQDAVTLNLPEDAFYQVIKLMFVMCVLISYPIQFFVPLERVEKWITRKCAPEKHTQLIYTARFSIVIMTLAVAELVPHLGLVIALMGAVAATALAVFFPTLIDLLVCYSKRNLTLRILLIDLVLMVIAFFVFLTGTYTALSDILKTFD